ncbi:MAG: polysaccharide deacetylase family protein [Thiolinea sp.]
MMKIMSVRRTGCALLVAGMLLGLSACDDNGNPLDTSGTIAPGSEAAKQIAADHHAAVMAETTSIEHLAKQANAPVTAEQRAEADKLSKRHRARMAARNAGDYSFQPPPASPVSRPGQLLNLPAVTSPRFTVTDRVWPDTVGGLSLAMWSQDKLAAFSLTIDDNHVKDHAFWYEMADLYGWKWTWFVIANQVGWAHHDHWGHWQKALDKGHDIQTHTYSHLCDALFYTYREYRQSQAVINQNLDGAKVVTMAYPFGVHSNKIGSPCAPLDTARTANDRDEAAKHFLAVRDVYGALSHPGRIDFLKVPSVSAARNFFDASRPWAYFDSVFDAGSANYRTWYSAHYHGLYNDAQKDAVRDVLAHVKAKEADVWAGTFTEIAKYAQEYASAAFSGVQTTANSVRFELKDEMNDDWFDEPLTVKVRLPDGWAGSVNATQAGSGLTSSIVQHNGASYAMVDVVPDRGLVVLTF